MRVYINGHEASRADWVRLYDDMKTGKVTADGLKITVTKKGNLSISIIDD